MEEFAKVEKLMQRANVTYEEAREALRAANGDILDAMVELEKQGKTVKPEQTAYSTSYTAQPEITNVPATIEKQKSADEKESVWEKIKRGVKIAAHKLSTNFIQIDKKEEVLVKVPLWLFLIAFLCFWHGILILMIISLFFDCRYKFIGEDEDKMKTVNKVMDQTSDFAEQVKEDVQKKNDEKDDTQNN